MNVRERMKSGRLYFSNDDSLVREQLQRMEILYDFNATRPSEMPRRMELLRQFLGSLGDNCYIEPPLHANWGSNTHFGRDVYANFNLTLVDDAEIFVGDSVLFGPNVTVATAGHPIDPDLRRRVAQFTRGVRIGSNVWIGAGAVILPGVTIGDDSVIGAGAVVSRDIPPRVVALGVPCRVVRAIGEHDREYYFRDLKIDLDDLNSCR